jgi:aminoglycoside phosphotransferase (APT) family kinase protein
MGEERVVEQVARPVTSQRDPQSLRAQLEAWLGTPATALEIPETNGMSSETVLFEAFSKPLVARLAPDPAAMPVFPRYDLALQAQVMRLVRAHSAVPAPVVVQAGEDFVIMERAYGDVPPDVMPYNFGSWLTEAQPEQRQRLQHSSVRLLAQLHSIDPALMPFDRESTLADQNTFYEWVCADGVRSPLIEQCLAWLDRHQPSERDVRFSWGDARIGNVMYRDFEPVAVFDWEMAGLAPREADLAWFVFLHRFFEDLAHGFELPGLPDFLRQDEVCAQYEELTGYTPRDMVWYELYAALRFAVIYFRIQRRRIHFGEASMPDDPDEMIIHHALLRRMLEAVR